MTHFRRTNGVIIFHKFVQISLIFRKIVQILFCQFLENGNRNRVEIFRVHLFLDGLSDDISHIKLTW